MNENIEKLVHAIANLRDTQTPIKLRELQDAINECANGYCADVIFTNNIDKIAFGVMVVPTVTPEWTTKILVSCEEEALKRYQVELDSKLFLYSLEDDEIAAVLLYNIIRLIDNKEVVERLRNTIDAYFVETGTQLKLRESIQYGQLLKLGLVDTLIKYSNCIYCDFDIKNDPIVASMGMGMQFISGLSKLRQSIPGCSAPATNVPKIIILDWCFRLYGDVEHERIPAINQLKRAKEIGGSVLYNKLIDDAIDALYRIDNDTILESAYQEYVTEAKKGSILWQMKYNGIRGIEDDLYEYIIRIKKATTEDEAIYILKQINARLSILDDFIRNEELTDEEKQRWTDVYIKYKNIRDQLAKKKIYDKKNYGIFYNYDNLNRDDDIDKLIYGDEEDDF